MLKILSLVLVLLVVGMGVVVFAHSTPIRESHDPLGGHNCWINCEQLGLRQGEYHLHEKK